MTYYFIGFYLTGLLLTVPVMWILEPPDALNRTRVVNALGGGLFWPVVWLVVCLLAVFGTSRK